MKGKYFVQTMLCALLLLPACADQPTALDIDSDAVASSRGRGGRHARSFVARLAGDAEVPAVATIATGIARFELDPHGNKLHFAVYAANAPAITQAHIHLGASGENGPVVAFLFGLADPGVSVDGLLANGWLTDDDVIARDGFDGTMRELAARLATERRTSTCIPT